MIRKLFIRLSVAILLIIILCAWELPLWKLKSSGYRKRSSSENYNNEMKLAMQEMSKSNFTHFIPIQNLRLKNIFYNRIEKCGSRSLVSVVCNLKRANKFQVEKSKVYTNRRLTGEDLKKEKELLIGLTPPTFYERHIFHINFEEYNDKKPILINMVRDPIERFVSHFSYEKYGDVAMKISPSFPDREDINDCISKEIGVCQKENTMMFNIGLYFCGMSEDCLNVFSNKRVEIAKRNIDERYSFIGSAEEFGTSLQLLEKMFPEFFRKSLHMWKGHHRALNLTATKKKDFLTDESWRKLRYELMMHEYEVYHHALRKFINLKGQFGIE
ncbi:uronyl 2-sulfotransferase-like [Styela clava]